MFKCPNCGEGIEYSTELENGDTVCIYCAISLLNNKRILAKKDDGLKEEKKMKYNGIGIEVYVDEVCEMCNGEYDDGSKYSVSVYDAKKYVETEGEGGHEVMIVCGYCKHQLDLVVADVVENLYKEDKKYIGFEKISREDDENMEKIKQCNHKTNNGMYAVVDTEGKDVKCTKCNAVFSITGSDKFTKAEDVEFEKDRMDIIESIKILNLDLPKNTDFSYLYELSISDLLKELKRAEGVFSKYDTPINPHVCTYNTMSGYGFDEITPVQDASTFIMEQGGFGVKGPFRTNCIPGQPDFGQYNPEALENSIKSSKYDENSKKHESSRVDKMLESSIAQDINMKIGDIPKINTGYENNNLKEDNEMKERVLTKESWDYGVKKNMKDLSEYLPTVTCILKDDVIEALDIGRRILSESIPHDEEGDTPPEYIELEGKLSDFVLNLGEFNWKVDQYVKFCRMQAGRIIDYAESETSIFYTMINLPSLKFLSTPEGYLWFNEEFISKVVVSK